MNQDSLELISLLRVGYRRKLLIIMGTVLFIVIIGILSLFLPKTYETTLNLKVGNIWEKPIEDSVRVAETINSIPFLSRIVERLKLGINPEKLKSRKWVKANVIESGPPLRLPILVSLTTRGRTPKEAIDIANAISDLIISDHKPRFDQKIKEYYEYEKSLDSKIIELNWELKELERLIKGVRRNPGVNAPSVILLQSQLEAKQGLLLTFIKELRDVRVNTYSTINSENTKVMDAPVLPNKHVKPNLLLNILIAGILGFVLSFLLALFLDYIKKTGGLKEKEK